MITVCIVEDQQIMRKEIEAILEASDTVSCIGSFPNAELFIKEFDNLQPDITLIDIDLPGISGTDTIFQIKSIYPRAKFLVLTVFNDDEKIFKALKAGAGGYLLKKNASDQLREQVVALFNNGAPMSPEIARRVIHFFQHPIEPFPVNELTEKEKSVLALIVEGYLYREISAALNLDIDAIKKHAHNIYEKLQIRNRSELVRKFLSR